MKINIKNIKVKSICATLFIFLFLSCNSGIEELENKNNFFSSLANLRQDFLDVFTYFGDIVTDSLGIKAETKKDDIGGYFSKIESTMKNVQDKLKNVAEKYGHYPKVKEKVAQFIEQLVKIEEGAKEASKVEEGAELLGNMEAKNSGGKPGEVDKLIKAIQTIVNVVLAKGNPEAGNNLKAKDGQTPRANNNDSAGNLFANNQAGTAHANAKEAATDAAKAVGAVTGADILKAIVKEGGAAATLAKNNTTHDSVNAVADANDAVVAGAIALRAMTKNGKFAGNTSAENAVAIVKNAAASAVNKTLSTLVIAIRNTVDTALKAISEALAAIKQGDMSADTSESGNTK
ncbi:variable large family protein (plasmid) [Borrelia coriaceae]|uniref:Variable large protein n=1 Tax=Borrelia coriaceae ATCC 43381 TaxID=1408429 RepID=W5SX88_9SPIR|nr:variable large family protein [Borrelia coriaceae]AHH11799.1 Variable outer membrane protein [Borrelia coriaceae ATCC 43381]UPA17115.1 variable large family protein [Borrelia coriaceae]UPA17226.1 variable large family protein [Borrelia coriaceae]